MSIERSIPELAAWYAQYDDVSYRSESPDAYHHELLRTAEALRDDGTLDWDDWLALKALADEAHVRALEDAVQAHVNDPDA
ncbi:MULTISPECIES: hypothetical protein [Pseudomonas]|jgi:hypothetical protein|uniref:Uncharacterized protein n=1 Tax=Pseudomonas juntendi TaxID=2666183 RepID=A0A7W2JHC4_9PSED|nr:MULTISPECIES: hypothetical protein [Pseudomonas]PPB17149.1 hypothetical protein HV87_22075 [Pseudomonas aeruginosa]EGB96562.1 hypothetical protein G1E_23015 [Pseudomonas sp. TJI-51]MBA6058995.1 hypothetical protein [Pseudomonas juntendi]MBA6097363.1 hypothetical protein [Pseudomonas juntendi]MBA6120233.1 hypothetical protein [Pseudomonas juntendi]